MPTPTRRAVLRGAPALLGALAGCDAFTERDDATPRTSTAPATEPAAESGTGVGDEAESMAAPARTLELRNVDDDTRFVSVAVSDDTGVISSSTVEVPGGTKRSLSLSAPTGLLRVDLETTTGLTASHQWVVGDTMGDLVVTLAAEDVHFAQNAWCTPSCDPLSNGGTAAEFPYYGGPFFMTSSYGANVVVENDAPQTLDVTVGITHDGDSILEYAYTVPPDVTLEFPGVHSSGSYTVSVQSDVGDLQYDWRPPKERSLQVTLTGTGVQATCGHTTASLILRNDDATGHRVGVTAFRPDGDRPEFSNSYIVQPGANFRDRGVFTGSGQYELHVRTSEGAVATYDWWLCPPRGPTQITIQPNGKLHVVQFQPGAGRPIVR
jgi:hypothetical protein